MSSDYPATPNGRWPICSDHKIRLYPDNRGWGWRCKECLAENKSTRQPYHLNKKGKAYPVSIREFAK